MKIRCNAVRTALVAGVAGAVAIAVSISLFASGQIGSTPTGSIVDLDGGPRRLVFAGIIGNGSSQVYAVNDDGSGLMNLTNDNLWNIKPAVSPDGSKVAYLGYEGGVAPYGATANIYVINSDGSSKQKVTEVHNGIGRVVWSPDSSRIAFEETNQISVVNADGTDRKTLTDDERPVSNFNPAWMSDDRIAFEKVRYDENERRFPESSFYEIQVNTGNITKLFDFDYNISGAHVWSPDQTKIAFKQGEQQDGALSGSLLYVMDAQGHDPTKLTSSESGSPMIPVWGSDSHKIVFNNGQEFIEVKTNNASIRNLAKSEQNDSIVAWSDDGNEVAFERSMGEEGYAICVMDSDGSDQKKIVELRYPNFGESVDWLP